MFKFRINLASIARLGIAVVAVAHVAPQVDASIVLPVTGGQANGGGFNTFDRAFNAQPTSVPTVGVTTEDAGTNYQLDYGNYRAGFVDFGSDFADIELTDVFVLLKRFANGTNGQAIYFWSNDLDSTFEAIEGDEVAPNFDVFNTQGADTSSSRWIQAWSGSEAPAHRYLIVGFEGATQDHSNGLGEIAFVGTVPEPASLAMASLGAMLVLGRGGRRSS